MLTNSMKLARRLAPLNAQVSRRFNANLLVPLQAAPPMPK